MTLLKYVLKTLASVGLAKAHPNYLARQKPNKFISVEILGNKSATIVVRRSYHCVVQLLNYKRRRAHLVQNVSVMEVLYAFRIPIHREESISNKKMVFRITIS